jgi:gas vesicle protein
MSKDWKALLNQTLTHTKNVGSIVGKEISNSASNISGKIKEYKDEVKKDKEKVAPDTPVKSTEPVESDKPKNE